MSLSSERRVAIITGGAGGLGAAVAELLAERGINIALVDVRHDVLQATGDRLRKHGTAVQIVQRDLSIGQECELVVPEVVGRLGRVDILVNAAAVLSRQDLEEVSPESFDHIFHTNAMAVFLLSRAAISDMETRQWGRIVNITSTGVYQGGLTMTSAIYEASKGAVAVFTKMFAKYGASRGVLVNTVCPGGMRTRMALDETPEELLRQIERELIPLGRLADPVEVARMIAWLVSDEATYATGAEFDVTGGLALH